MNHLFILVTFKAMILWKGGGDAQDGMSGMNLNVSMFTTTGNSTLHGTWNIYTSGITRVNSALGLCATDCYRQTTLQS